MAADCCHSGIATWADVSLLFALGDGMCTTANTEAALSLLFLSRLGAQAWHLHLEQLPLR